MTHSSAISFGKYKGTAISEVPVDYLVWVLDTFRNPPIVVVSELERRGAEMSGGAAFLAQAALGKWKHTRAVRASKPSRGGPRRKAKAASRKQEQRQVAGEKVRALSRGARIVGSDFASSRERWERSGGDPASCPFGDGEEADAMQHLKSIANGG